VATGLYLEDPDKPVFLFFYFKDFLFLLTEKSGRGYGALSGGPPVPIP
jgi:hypothetical protein